MLKVSAFYLEKRKSFIPKKNIDVVFRRFFQTKFLFFNHSELQDRSTFDLVSCIIKCNQHFVLNCSVQILVINIMDKSLFILLYFIQEHLYLIAKYAFLLHVSSTVDYLRPSNSTKLNQSSNNKVFQVRESPNNV